MNMKTETKSIAKIIAVTAGVVLILLLFRAANSSECKIVVPSAIEATTAEQEVLTGADYSSSKLGGGYWIKDGEILGYSDSENETVKTLGCYPELSS